MALVASLREVRSSWCVEMGDEPRVVAFSGQRFGVYELHGCLGGGGMGEVYRARDTGLGRDVAAKILLHAVAADADRPRPFRARSAHPRLVRGRPVALFRYAGVYRMSGTAIAYDVHPDGKRFIMVSEADGSGDAGMRQQVNAILNWLDELKQRVAPAR